MTQSKLENARASLNRSMSSAMKMSKQLGIAVYLSKISGISINVVKKHSEDSSNSITDPFEVERTRACLSAIIDACYKAKSESEAEIVAEQACKEFWDAENKKVGL